MKRKDAEYYKQYRLRKAEKQPQTSNAQSNTQRYVNRPEIEADDCVFEVWFVPLVSQDTTSIDAEFKKRFYKFGFACSVCDRLWFEKGLRDIRRASR